MPKICPHYTRVAWVHDTDKHQVILTRLGCGSWGCDYCAALLKRKWLRLLRRKMPEISDKWWLVTFTAPQQSYTQEDSLQRLRRGIDIFFKRARRIWKGIEYVRVYEPHKSRTTVHAHLVVTGLSPFVKLDISRNGRVVYSELNSRVGRRGAWSIKTFTKKTAQACGMGYIADVREVDSVKAIFYVTKYLTKMQSELNVKGLRHVQTTRGIGGIKTEKTPGWIVGYRLNKIQVYGDETVYDAQRKALVSGAYWRMADIYPPLTETK